MSLSQPSKFGLRSSGSVARAPLDATTVLSIYAALLLGIPSDLAVGTLGGAGAPSSLFGLGMLLWWCWHQIHVNRTAGNPRPANPIRLSFLVFFGCVMASFVVASLSPLPLPEANGADRALLQMAAFAGIVFVAHDGIPAKERFIVLARRIALFGGLYASLGLLQFLTNRSYVDAISIPGLQPSGFGGIDIRGGFVRASATGIHSVEYAMVLTMVLPLALTLALRDTNRPLLSRWFPATALVLASVLSVSRSALIGIAAVMLVLVVSWRPAERRIAVWVALAAGAMIYLFVPGMAGTLLGMFGGGDPSITSRTDSYGIAVSFISESPILGRGLGTFLPAYRILDNQYLGLLIEIGFVGTVAFLGVLVTAMATAWRGRSREAGLHRDLGPALLAAVVGGSLLTAFFDAFSFPQACGLLMLTCGMCGAYRNLERGPGVQA